MSPQHALHDPIFLAYVRIIFVSLVVGGIALGVLHLGFRKNLGSIWSTYRSWLIMAPVGMAAATTEAYEIASGWMLSRTQRAVA